MGRPKSGLTPQELQAKSDKKRGVRLASFKLHEDITALLVSPWRANAVLSKTQVVTQALQQFAENHRSD